MPNIASVLKAEISRLARRELKGQTEFLKKAVASSRVEIAALRKRVGALEKALKHASRATNAERQVRQPSPEQASDGLRFRAAGMASNRKRLGLSAADFGLLVGASGQSVYAWETGKSKPNAHSLAAIAALRGIGKREVEQRLSALK